MLYIGPHQTDTDLRGILRLQNENHVSNIDDEAQDTQGFLTVRHTFDLLKKMHCNYPATIVKWNDEVVAYALVMERNLSHEIPVLIPMFNMIEGLFWKDNPVQSDNWFVMGQICVGKDFRGQQLVPRMYQSMRAQLSSHFDYVLTEIAERNVRSIKAHSKVGFEALHTFKDETEDWRIVIWDWRE